jgi:DNA primase
MRKLSESARKFLAEATSLYHQSLPGSPAAEYLATRKLSGIRAQNLVDRFMLGYVAEPLPGHEMYAGMLAIPYLRYSQEKEWSVVSMRFRRLGGEGAKYLTISGDKPRMFNTMALLIECPRIAISEGEIDAITATVSGIPCVGIPGAQAWKPHFREPFLGYRDVYILADGDEAGASFAHTVAKTLPNAKIIPSPPGEDVNSLVVKRGPAALTERLR